MHIVYKKKDIRTLKVVQETLEKYLQEYNNPNTSLERKQQIDLLKDSLLEEQDELLSQKLNNPHMRIEKNPKLDSQ